jgi:hypothetical protein
MADLVANLAENAVMEATVVLHRKFLLDGEPLISSIDLLPTQSQQALRRAVSRLTIRGGLSLHYQT